MQRPRHVAALGSNGIPTDHSMAIGCEFLRWGHGQWQTMVVVVVVVVVDESFGG